LAPSFAEDLGRVATPGRPVDQSQKGQIFMYTFRRTVCGGVLFGVAVLAGIYYLDTHSSADKAGPDAAAPRAAPPPAANGALPAVLEMLHSRRPNARIDVVKWWPPKRVTLGNAERLACRLIYWMEVGQIRDRWDCAFDVGGPRVTQIRYGLENAESHSALDPLFP
jgi:hypothetical protein